MSVVISCTTMDLCIIHEHQGQWQMKYHNERIWKICVILGVRFFSPRSCYVIRLLLYWYFKVTWKTVGVWSMTMEFFQVMCCAVHCSKLPPLQICFPQVMRKLRRSKHFIASRIRQKPCYLWTDVTRFSKPEIVDILFEKFHLGSLPCSKSCSIPDLCDGISLHVVFWIPPQRAIA
jgi:hypothetical protein